MKKNDIVTVRYASGEGKTAIARFKIKKEIKAKAPEVRRTLRVVSERKDDDEKYLLDTFSDGSCKVYAGWGMKTHLVGTCDLPASAPV